MRYNIHFDFVKHRKAFLGFAVIATIVGILSLIFFNLNYGVDFRAGSSMDINVSQPMDKAAIEQFLAEEGYTDHRAPSVTIGAERVTIRFIEVLTDAEENKLKNDFLGKFDSDASFEVNTVDVEMANELKNNAIKAILIASIGIALYVSIRFEWRFAVSAIISLLFAAFFVITTFSLFRFEVNLPFIVAVLTIIGYAINDMIVIFDRIRDNMRFAKLKTADDIADLVNSSIWQTMTRSINTVATVLIAAVLLFALGSESIRLFSLAMVIGLIIGVYSSNCIACQIWFELRKRMAPKPKTAAKAT